MARVSLSAHGKCTLWYFLPLATHAQNLPGLNFMAFFPTGPGQQEPCLEIPDPSGFTSRTPRRMLVIIKPSRRPSDGGVSRCFFSQIAQSVPLFFSFFLSLVLLLWWLLRH